MTAPENNLTHAYIPGTNARHPDGAFDHIRSTAKMGMTAKELAQCHAFRIGLSYLDTGYFWEAHEVLEPVWMALPEECIERKFVQALIQFANARLKLEMQRPKAAKRLFAIVRSLFSQIDKDFVMGLSIQKLVNQVDDLDR